VANILQQAASTGRSAAVLTRRGVGWATAGHGIAQLSTGGGGERWQPVRSAVSAAIARHAASYLRRYHRIDFPSWSGDFCSSPSSIMPVETSFQRRKSLADRVKTLFAAALVTSIASRC